MPVKKLCLLMLVVFALTFSAAALDDPAPQCKAALVIDMNTETTLLDFHADERVYPASTTKIMTALLALEYGKLDEVATVSENAVKSLEGTGSVVSLKAGETFTLDELLHILLIPSSNDASNVIAEHVAGSTDAFVEKMNARAAALGCENTHFMNPHGLHDEEHYTTAADLYKITRAALQYDKFREIVALKEYRVEPTPLTEDVRHYYTTNYLLTQRIDPEYYYKKATGVKTGSTSKAGYCLVSTAEDKDLSLMCLVFGAQRDEETRMIRSFTESKRLMEWAFDSFTTKTLLKDAIPIDELPVRLAKGRDSVVVEPEYALERLVPKDLDVSALTLTNDLPEGELTAPIKKGDAIGTITVSDGDTVYGTVPLVAMTDVERSEVLYQLDRMETFVRSRTFRYIVAGIVGFIAFMVIFTIVINRRRARKKKYRGYRGRRRR